MTTGRDGAWRAHANIASSWRSRRSQSEAGEVEAMRSLRCSGRQILRTTRRESQLKALRVVRALVAVDEEELAQRLAVAGELQPEGLSDFGAVAAEGDARWRATLRVWRHSSSWLPQTRR